MIGVNRVRVSDGRIRHTTVHSEFAAQYAPKSAGFDVILWRDWAFDHPPEPTCGLLGHRPQERSRAARGAVAERLTLDGSEDDGILEAAVEFVPVMNADDLRMALAKVAAKG